MLINKKRLLDRLYFSSFSRCIFAVLLQIGLAKTKMNINGRTYQYTCLSRRECRHGRCASVSPPGKMVFNTVGLPDKAIVESRERERSALSAIGLGLPPERISVNLAPADLPKEGSHCDLPIALGLMVAMGALPPEADGGLSP